MARPGKAGPGLAWHGLAVRGKAGPRAPVLGYLVPAPVSKAGYRRYIRSPAWNEVKVRYRASKLPQVCRVCGVKRVDLHHRTYSHLGQERLRDLVPLCREHHRELHALQRKLRVDVASATTAYLKGARTTTVRKQPARRRRKRSVRRS